MYIVINVLGLPFNGETIKTRSLGGSETAGYYVAKELAARGHKVTLFTNSTEEGVFDGVRYVWAGKQTEEHPLGNRFHFYALRTQHDVCIIQRHPGTFAYRWASKINLLWLHDLVTHRSAGAINNCLWNIDGVLPVSKWHGDQIHNVWGVGADIIYPVRNGVDLELYGKVDNKTLPDNKFKLLYAARPERGLENLVRPDGIMHKLLEIAPDCHLYFCGYDNTLPQTKDYYEQLWQWADKLPNCTNLGALNKKDLAGIEQQCDLYVYPSNFEDTSCIIAMECAAAGLPFLASNSGALIETCEGAGAELLPLMDGGVDVDGFVRRIVGLFRSDELPARRSAQLEASINFSWARAADTFEAAITKCFEKTKKNNLSVLKHFEHISDIYALWKYSDAINNKTEEESKYLRHIDNVYAFAKDGNFKQHYEAYYKYEKQRGVNYGPEDLTGNHRFESVANIVSNITDGGSIMDYGCAHGHYTINLAKRFPKLHFIGVDIAESNIDTARKWASDDGIGNVEFYCGQVTEKEITISGDNKWEFDQALDCIIAAEVLEHVQNPSELTDILCSYLVPGGLFIATTPYGPWESVGYERHYPWRAHLWHFERGDLRDMYGLHPGFNVVSSFHGLDKRGEVLGSYITTFKKPIEKSGSIDYERKFLAIAPRQTVSVCMIVKDAESSIRATLESVIDNVDEVVIGIDETTTDETEEVVNNYLNKFIECGAVTADVFKIQSPLSIGFCEARNQVVREASCQWIFWLDADETLVHGNELSKYLRNNQYSGYAVALRHFTMEPAGLMRTDLPTKLFRNNIGIKFFGMVHEHPEINLNEGLGYVGRSNDIELSHFAYITEEVRRSRFVRNYGLMKRDREIFPDRLLGKWLWVRDTAQTCRWELENNGGMLTDNMERSIRHSIDLWKEVVDSGNTRLIMDGLQFYSELNAMLGVGFDFGCVLDTSKMNGGLKLYERQPILGRFSDTEDAKKVIDLVMHEHTKHYDSKYF